jgi:hypothetical protein
MSFSELLPTTLSASSMEAGGLVLMVGTLLLALRWLLGLPAQPAPVPVPVRREQRPPRRR